MVAVMLNPRIFAGGCDLTSASSQINVEAVKEKKDVTPFGADGWRTYVGGLGGGSFKGQGFWEAGDTDKVDDALWAALGANRPWSVFDSSNLTYAQSADYGTTCYLSDALHSQYKMGGKVGEVMPWTAEAEASWPMVRGVGIHPPGTARIANGNGTGVQHVAVAAGQYLYAALHVLSVAGTGSPSIVVKVQSDADNSWASPIDQITFTTATLRGGEIKRAAGPITDTWYRVNYAITGTSPSFLFVVTIGVA